ncbi:hypothetical protein ACRE_029440 [Hapsidospora chrysogenum ATCC 11550]|uniref:Uncharacterized protein n=1 Tax=Hapsidospora chrysogenum (strain ATCC 11550 / CBS 779.69 / DSM 880 / IAM 14645 / JCM 23072 / IMI 49137) TaxID=857340 RepID=A0A086TAD2_HAPC1|nr:hypothetical protein ACRE_029440 [Hapsidospora chrysogenum ATCC 11550]
MVAIACTGRRTVGVLFAISAIFMVGMFLISESFSRASWGYAQQVQEHWSNVLQHSDPTKIYNCADPYRRPGYLYIDSDDYKKTRWIPYTEDFLDAETPTAAEYPRPEGMDVSFNVTTVDEEFVESASTPRLWATEVLAEDSSRRKAVSTPTKDQTADDFVDVKDEGDLGWLWGRRVLLLGDSVDRYMIQFFCEEFGRKMHQPAPHTTATCEIPTFNLTLVHWHFAGSMTYRPDWWWMDDMKEISFEERFTNLWEPTLDTKVRGPTGQPDLLMWQSGLWDQRALWECAEARLPEDHPLGERERQLAWEEVRFVAARIRKFVGFLDDTFGPGVPTMFRAITMHNESDARDANLYELDRLSRAIGERAGHEMFEWARIITAFSMLYKDQTHAAKGPASWLWANMMLEYLARGAGAGDEDRAPYFGGWEACHQHLRGWGGR